MRFPLGLKLSSAAAPHSASKGPVERGEGEGDFPGPRTGRLQNAVSQRPREGHPALGLQNSHPRGRKHTPPGTRPHGSPQGKPGARVGEVVRDPWGSPGRTQPHPPRAPGGAGGGGRCCAAPGETCWENGGNAPVPIHFFSAGERFLRCVMGKDANMQTPSRIVPAQGEKLKHKSGGGKLRGGSPLQRGLAGPGEPACRLPGSRPSRASISSGFPRRRGGKKRVCVEGQAAGFLVCSTALQGGNRPPRRQAPGGGGWLPPGYPGPCGGRDAPAWLAPAVGTGAGAFEAKAAPAPAPVPPWHRDPGSAGPRNSAGPGGEKEAEPWGWGGISPLTSRSSPVTEGERVGSALEKAVGRRGGVCCLKQRRQNGFVDF